MGLLEGQLVLVVEDSHDDAAALRAVLEGAGARVQWAYDAEHARRLFEQHSYYGVVSDIVLPGESGVSLVRDLVARFPLLRYVCVSRVSDGPIWSLTDEKLLVMGLPPLVHKVRDLDRLPEILVGPRPAPAPGRTMARDRFEELVAQRVGTLLASRSAAELAEEFLLSPQELRALDGVCRGLSDVQISEILDVTRHRVSQVLRSAFKKLGVRGRHGLLELLHIRGAKPRPQSRS